MNQMRELIMAEPDVEALTRTRIALTNDNLDLFSSMGAAAYRPMTEDELTEEEKATKRCRRVSVKESLEEQADIEREENEKLLEKQFHGCSAVCGSNISKDDVSVCIIFSYCTQYDGGRGVDYIHLVYVNVVCTLFSL